MTKTVRSSTVPPGTRGEQTREKILRTAARLLGRMGFRRTTITEIAEGAGIGKATVYLYFKDKQDILTCLVQQETASILDEIKSAVDSERTAADRLRAFILTRYRSIQSLLELYSTAPQLLIDDLPAIQKAAQEYGEQELDVVQTLLCQGCATGELDVKDTHLAAIAVTGTLRSLDQPWLFQRAPLDLEQRIDDLIHHFLYGMSARKDTV